MADNKVAKGFKGLAIFNAVVAVVFLLIWLFAGDLLDETVLYLSTIILGAINAAMLWGSGEKVEDDRYSSRDRSVGTTAGTTHATSEPRHSGHHHGGTYTDY